MDTIVFSDTLNYVDFRKVLNEFANYLKPEGRIIVLNFPYRGNTSYFPISVSKIIVSSMHF